MKKLAYLLTFLCSCHAYCLESEHVLWEKEPITVNLTLNKERMVHFPQAISIVDSEASDKLAVLKVQDTLYLRAKNAFAEQRLLVQLMPEGDVIILSLTADESESTNLPIEIMLEEKTEPASDNNSDYDINAISLTRFAIQSLYSPERLLVIPEGVNRTPMQTRRQIPLFYGVSIEARPLISWHASTFYVTAIELKNLLNKEVIVDPRRMVGHWQTASFYPTNTLGPRGKEDTTTVFLVSDRPFHEAFNASRGYVR
ncbi:hypothetical protein Lsan_3898 [Legionella santicrucis]|uniref:Integrating conjugative element protein, PFL_4704 family n=1 Tax=Legionella santicrucis TaxID=45074 RepID=A0A0W0Y9K1_9GAMM|nr:TIGR03749 family integrating conjugative element protein [Legionella santicrucis]KTD53488.1 hypothetical protein Lsan_3898 [Legionella santicrucis]